MLCFDVKKIIIFLDQKIETQIESFKPKQNIFYGILL